MTELNMANRQCCDLFLLDYVTKKEWMYVDFCNTTTAGFTSDAVYALKKGARDIKFDNPMEATISFTFQVHPFQVYALYSDCEVENSAVIVRREVVAGGTGTLTVTGTPITGTLFVKKESDGTDVAGSVSDKTFTATNSGDVTADEKYVVTYLEAKDSGVKKISFNNKKVPKYFYAQMATVNKNENGELVPVRITAYKICPQRTLELSFSSTGDPAEITITCDAMTDKNGDVLDMIEITDEIA